MEKVWQLTHLERIGPKGWLRYVFPFQLDDNYNLDEVTRILRDGYEVTCQRLPPIGCVRRCQTMMLGVRLSCRTSHNVLLHDLVY